MVRTIEGHMLALVSLLVLLLLLGDNGADGQQFKSQPVGDVVFPPVNDLAIGDPCTIPPSPSSIVRYARTGTCRRVRECSTFVRRIILEPFDIRRDVCYFEVHDPVVCCMPLPAMNSAPRYELLPRDQTIPDDVEEINMNDINLIH